jgi:hypothetical protein
MRSTTLRLFGGIAGLLVGGLLGFVVLIALIMISGSTFGLDNVRSGAVVGAGVGLVIGLCLPEAALKTLYTVLSGI